MTPSTYVARARIYVRSEFSTAVVPAPPPAPRNAVSYFGGTTTRIDWQSDGRRRRFSHPTLDRLRPDMVPVAIVPTDARTVSVTAKIGDLFRVCTFGPGGISDGPLTSIGSMFRRPGTRH